MLVATVILVLGKNLYVMKPPQGNILTKVCGSIWVRKSLNILKYYSYWFYFIYRRVWKPNSPPTKNMNTGWMLPLPNMASIWLKMSNSCWRSWSCFCLCLCFGHSLINRDPDGLSRPPGWMELWDLTSSNPIKCNWSILLSFSFWFHCSMLWSILSVPSKSSIIIYNLTGNSHYLLDSTSWLNHCNVWLLEVCSPHLPLWFLDFWSLNWW